MNTLSCNGIYGSWWQVVPLMVFAGIGGITVLIMGIRTFMVLWKVLSERGSQ